MNLVLAQLPDWEGGFIRERLVGLKKSILGRYLTAFSKWIQNSARNVMPEAEILIWTYGFVDAKYL